MTQPLTHHTRSRHTAGVRWTVAVVLATRALAAWSDGVPQPSSPSPRYQQECAACHIAYPPALLPAASWQRLMGSLDRHFGTDATLDAASIQDITRWLTQNAGRYRRVQDAPPLDRITRSAWFVRQHSGHEVPADVWKRAAVGSPANCAACHTRADQGRFDERDIRIPK